MKLSSGVTATFDRNSPAPDKASYLEEFASQVDTLLHAIDKRLRADQVERLVSDELLRDWEYFHAARYDFYRRLESEIEEARR